MKVGLLDVNVLIALAWPRHIHHRDAHAWFERNHCFGWATCPLTQCGFVRVSSNPAIMKQNVTPLEALAVLREIMALDYHEFWPDEISLQENPAPASMMAGHRQVTDAYLLSLAIGKGGKLITFDRHVAALLPKASARTGAMEILDSSL